VGEPISVLILNYNASAEALKACVASVDGSACADLAEIVIVENGSTEHRSAPAEVAAGFDRARVVDLGHNWGFSGGINRGVAACRSPRVFVLNNDTEVDPDALAACAEVLDRQPPECLAAVPKLLFLDNRHLIDAVGNGIDAVGSAFNVGIGQLDVGQYDRVERCFGPCFAAGLFRREAFDDDHVGPLDESYFMYYEDVDWNWRANLFGYHFVTAPAARVYHVHSAASRHLDYSFKYRLIERNLLTTVLKNFEGGRAVRVWVRRLVAHLRNLVRGRYPAATVRIVAEAVRRLPATWAARQAVARRRVRSDIEVIRLAHGELPYFNPAEYAPQYTFANLAAMYQRKALVEGERRWLDVAEMARALETSRLRFEPGFIADRLLPLLDGEPDFIHDFVRRIEVAQV
jgi:GT2 family glycosyltransferase